MPELNSTQLAQLADSVSEARVREIIREEIEAALAELRRTQSGPVPR